MLSVLSFCANDGILAEHLCDFIFLQNSRVSKGHALLVVAADVHAEMEARVKLAAEVAFDHVEIIKAPPVADFSKNLRVNTQFKTAAEHVAKTYRVPWLWLEPDAVPLKPGWLETIASAHYDQPKRYSGSWLMSKDLFLARIAVYPADAINDLAPFLNGHEQFNRAAGSVIIPKSTKTRLVQEVVYSGEDVKVAETAVMLHKDPNAILLTSLRERFEQVEKKK
jgi:hypothetical protein